ncbi:MAG: peptide chain release factor-like protein [Rubritalea sp.]|uniref:peptide chain release factor family protein n=1 Tax=Rubritalea sp. TaxID=2109375 RepID=UPI0032429162
MSQLDDIEQKLTKLGAPASTIVEKFIQGSGSGGQKINKTSSCVYLKHLPTGIEVKCQGERSRETNRQLAREELYRKIKSLYDKAADEKKDAREKKRRTNRPRSRNSKNRMLKGKKQNAQKKNLRRKPGVHD